MEIQNNILRHYLKNCYFINGTAYAGKSTMCRMLAERYGMVHCEENYNMDTILSVATGEEQPNINYFHTMKSWQEYVSRTPEEYERWYEGNQWEVAGFEVAELIRLSADQKVIVDTNIPCPLLKEISDYRRVAILLSPQSLSVERFFDREDPEKTMRNFRACIAEINSPESYRAFAESGFFTLVREEAAGDTREETLAKLAAHFGLS